MIFATAQFNYHGFPRLQLCFDNPNHLGVALVLLLLASTTLAEAIERKFTGLARTSLFAGSVLLIGAVSCLLALTYSRSAIVTLLVGLGLLWRYQQERKYVIVTGAAILVFVLLVPRFHERLVSGAVGDGATSARFEVWRGTLELLGDNPRGLGIFGFGEHLTGWKLEPSKRTVYRTAVNNVLTFGAFFGYWGIGLYSTLVALGLLTCLVDSDERTPLVLILIVTQWTLAVAGLFSFWCDSNILNCVWAAILLASILRYIYRHGYMAVFRTGARAIAIGTVCTALCMITAICFSHFADLRVHATELDMGMRKRVFSIIKPRVQNGTVVVWASIKESGDRVIAPFLRSLALQGYTIIVPNLDEGGKDDMLFLRKTISLFLSDGGQVLVFGLRDAARAAGIAAFITENRPVREIWLADVEGYWADANLDLARQIHQSRCQVRIWCSNDRFYSDALKLRTAGARGNVPVFIERLGTTASDGGFSQLFSAMRNRLEAKETP